MATRAKDLAKRSTKYYVEEALYKRLFRRGSTPQAVREEVDGFLDSRKRAFKWEVGVCVRRLRRQELYRPALKVKPFPPHPFPIPLSSELCFVVPLVW
jgi:hypothetical protein